MSADEHGLGDGHLLPFHAEIGEVREAFGLVVDGGLIVPQPGSKATTWRSAFADPDLVDTAFDHATYYVVAADDALRAYCTLTRLQCPIAFYATARQVLEAAAHALWLLRGSDVATMAYRCQRLRVRGLENQMKAMKAADVEETEATVAEARRRIRAIKDESAELGLAEPSAPSSTEVVTAGLGTAYWWSFLSAAAHGDNWALRQLSYGDPDGDGYIWSTFSADAAAIVANEVGHAFGGAAFQLATDFGYETEEAMRRADRARDRMAARAKEIQSDL